MKRTLQIGVLAAVLTIAWGPAAALTPGSGYSSVELFDGADVAALGGWSDLATVGLRGAINGNNIGSDSLATDGSGRIYAVVRGYDDYNDLTWYDGIVRVGADGSGLETLDRLTVDWVDVSGTGWVSYGDIRAISVGSVHVATGALAERLLVLRTGVDASGDRTLEILAYELTTGGDGGFDAESLCTLATIDGPFSAHLAVDSASGTVFLLQGMPGTSEAHDGSIRAFDWNSSSGAYVERSTPVTSAQVAFRDLVFHKGDLYTFDLANRSAGSGSDPILSVDPDGSDVTSSYAEMRQSAAEGSYYGWASAGDDLYIAEWVTKRHKRSGEITVVVPGETTSSANRIATFGEDPVYAMAGGADGSLAVMSDPGTGIAVYRLAASTGGGGSSGGGGKGGGKGKNK